VEGFSYRVALLCVGRKDSKVEEGSQTMGQNYEITFKPKSGSPTTSGNAPSKNGRK
jgi:hypothetical protein